ncbi:MAG: hypothetical protein H0T88_09320 [Lysobacter sp.]|nr:hypothetical protein [Lysobacter sp.]
MSIRSKAKRDAQKKQATRASRNSTPAPRIEPHAELRDSRGALLGGIARQDDEWVLGLDGQIVGGSASAATILTMLKRAAAMQERAGHQIVLKFSAALRQAAQQEADAKGMTLEQFEAELDQSLRQTDSAAGGPSSSLARH